MSLKNVLVWIGSHRAYDHQRFYQAGIDVREFFDCHTADKFLSNHFSSKNTSSSSTIFAVVASGIESLRYLADHAEVLKLRDVVLAGVKPTTGVESNESSIRPGSTRKSSSSVGVGSSRRTSHAASPTSPKSPAKLSAEMPLVKDHSGEQQQRDVEFDERKFDLMIGDHVQLISLLADMYRDKARVAGKKSPLGAATHAKNDQVALEIKPPPELPEGTTFISEGPLGPVWACVDPLTKEKVTAREIILSPSEKKAGPAHTSAAWKELFEAQVKVTKECPKHLIGPSRFTTHPDGTVHFVFTPRFSVHFERTFRGDPMPMCVVLQTLNVVVRAMKHVHDAGCLFRCVSLRSVVFGYDNQIKLLSSYVLPYCQRKAHKSWLMGWYTAPEGLRDASDFSTKSDMWSLGCLIVRMLTGKRPFAHLAVDESSFLSYLRDHYEGKGILSVSSALPAGTSEALRLLVDSLLSFDPARRPSIDEVLNSELFSLAPDSPLLHVDAPDRVLDNANFTLEPIPEGSSEFSEVYDALGRALLKAKDTNDLELLGVKKINNKIVMDRFAVKNSMIGNPSIGFYGAPQNNVGSILRYGVLRSGHRLNPQDMSKWMERGTIGSTKRGIYISKSPAKACTFTQADPLDEGDVCTIIICDCVLGKVTPWPKGMILAEGDYKGEFNAFEGENEVYLLDEAQMRPSFVLTVKVLRQTSAQLMGGKRRYCLFKRCLGKGAFGVVFLAMQYPESRPVAVKKFLHSKPSECRSEFDVLLKLRDYRHIVKVLHYEIKNDVPYMFMELLACSIKDLIDNFGPMPEDQVIKYLKDAAAGLESLRLEGLVHCDIKPANIMISYDGTLKLADFGLTRMRSDASGFGGTLPYMAPELLDGHPHSHASDIWALGASCWSMLTGRIPFDDIDSTNQFAFIYKRLTALGGELELPQGIENEDLRSLLEQCLSIDPDDRPTPLECARAAAMCSPTVRLGDESGMNSSCHNETESIAFSLMEEASHHYDESRRHGVGSGGGGHGSSFNDVDLSVQTSASWRGSGGRGDTTSTMVQSSRINFNDSTTTSLTRDNSLLFNALGGTVGTIKSVEEGADSSTTTVAFSVQSSQGNRPSRHIDPTDASVSEVSPNL